MHLVRKLRHRILNSRRLHHHEPIYSAFCIYCSELRKAVYAVRLIRMHFISNMHIWVSAMSLSSYVILLAHLCTYLETARTLRVFGNLPLATDNMGAGPLVDC
jgi:hypothetical protein